MSKLKRKLAVATEVQVQSAEGQVIKMPNTDSGGVIRWLGIPNKPGYVMVTDYDFVLLGQKGLTKKSIIALADNIGINRKEMAEDIFDISVKTLERKGLNEKLDKRISSHAVEIARLVQHAYEVFGSMDKVKLWIARENRALNNMKPVKLFDTLTGLSMVNDILTRIEEGVYS